MGQDVSKEERDDEGECPELKKLHCERPDLLTDELDPHAFSVLISGCEADLHPQLPTPLLPRGSWRRKLG